MVYKMDKCCLGIYDILPGHEVGQMSNFGQNRIGNNGDAVVIVALGGGG